ncbi:DUF2750 domain-containing protein [Apibacter mensalis]|uniref:DUF2750 domain-containing protein n=1 Tax=Apibacter mensalis TaxID=1586267 RepID=UPI0026F30889|nr:DUF2750 domain-containing protein [Apibacter mensalis]
MRQQKFDNVSKLEPLDRYKYFIKKIADFEELWTILDVNNDYALSDVEEYTLISFWPEEEFVFSNLDKEWKDCRPVKIDLDELYNTIFPIIEANKYLLNIFPINGRTGFVVDLIEFKRDLEEELENY